MIVAAVAVVALSRHRWLALVHALVAVAGSAVVIATIRAHPQIAEASGYSGAGAVALAVAADARRLRSRRLCDRCDPAWNVCG